MNYARLNYASLSLVLVMGGCLLEAKSLCSGDYVEEGDTSLARDCRWDFCRRNPGDSRCVDAAQPDAEDATADDDAGQHSDGDVDGSSGEEGGSGDASDGAVEVEADTYVPECLRNLDCPPAEPLCAVGECGRCKSNSDCSGRAAAPACDPVTGGCVVCTDSSQALCSADNAICKTGGNKCVECNVGNDCDEAAPRCDVVSNTCGKCVTNEDCGRWGKVCEAGQCVQCTVATERTQCPDLDPAPGDQGPACDPVAKTCTGEPRGSVGTCGLTGDQRVVRCVSDSECAAGRSCLATTFKGQPFGKYCLRKSNSCSAPWPIPMATMSIGGIEGPFCAPRELLATCEAVLKFGAACLVDSDCGTGGHCEQKRCTYACSGSSDCAGSTCKDFDSGMFCNPF